MNQKKSSISLSFRLPILILIFAILLPIDVRADFQEVNSVQSSTGCRKWKGVNFKSNSYSGFDIDLMSYSYSNGKLTIKFNRDLSCSGEWIQAHLMRSDNIICLSEEYFTDFDSVADCICNIEFTVICDDLSEGDYYFIASKGCYKIKLSEGCTGVITPEEDSNEYIPLNEDLEWVYYNAGKSIDDSKIIRMRLQHLTDAENAYSVKYCIGDYDENNSNTLNCIIKEDQYKSRISSYSLDGCVYPSILLGLNDSWNNQLSNQRFFDTYIFGSSPSSMYESQKAWYVYNKIVDVKPTVVDGKQSFHYFFDNGLQLVMGVGPVGNDYASNLVFPACDLPEGTIPTHFLYLRSLKDNRIIYGDPNLDPSYSGTSPLIETNDAAWFDNGIEFGFQFKGSGILTVYDVNGKCVAEQRGIDSISMEYSQLNTGIYLVRAIAPGLMLTRKIIVK